MAAVQLPYVECIFFIDFVYSCWELKLIHCFFFSPTELSSYYSRRKTYTYIHTCWQPPGIQVNFSQELSIVQYFLVDGSKVMSFSKHQSGEWGSSILFCRHLHFSWKNSLISYTLAWNTVLPLLPMKIKPQSIIPLHSRPQWPHPL